MNRVYFTCRKKQTKKNSCLQHTFFFGKQCYDHQIQIKKFHMILKKEWCEVVNKNRLFYFCVFKNRSVFFLFAEKKRRSFIKNLIIMEQDKQT